MQYSYLELKQQTNIRKVLILHYSLEIKREREGEDEREKSKSYQKK